MGNVVRQGRRFITQIDWWFIGPVLFLLSLGLVMQYTIAVNQGDDQVQNFSKQLTLVLIGLLGFAGINFLDHRSIKSHPFVYYGTALTLLIAVLAFGVTIQGTTGWFVFAGFSFQPVELVKFLFILFLATFFEKQPDSMQKPRYFFASAAAAALLVGLVLLQPDLGSAFILFMIWFGYVLMLRTPKRLVALVMGGVALAATLGWLFLFEQYQKDRLTTFINPDADPLGSGYNVTQSIVAIGSGSFWGRGLGLGTQSQLHFLPEVTTDFIFAAMAEELGFIGVLVLLTALGALLFRIWTYMNRTRDHYVFLFLLGTFVYLAVQSLLAIGMNLGLLPVTGVPLPLVSAGGSSVLVTLLMLGVAHHMGQTQTESPVKVEEIGR